MPVIRFLKRAIHFPHVDGSIDTHCCHASSIWADGNRFNPLRRSRKHADSATRGQIEKLDSFTNGNHQRLTIGADRGPTDSFRAIELARRPKVAQRKHVDMKIAAAEHADPPSLDRSAKPLIAGNDVHSLVETLLCIQPVGLSKTSHWLSLVNQHRVESPKNVPNCAGWFVPGDGGPIGLPSAIFQIRTVRSYAEVAISRPSGLNVTCRTVPVCPEICELTDLCLRPREQARRV